jgi:hypothetical protein
MARESAVELQSLNVTSTTLDDVFALYTGRTLDGPPGAPAGAPAGSSSRAA